MKNGRKLVKVDCIRRWLEDRNVGARSNVSASRLDSGSYASAACESQKTYSLSVLQAQTEHLNLINPLVIVYLSTMITIINLKTYRKP
jgi:hypothetical protein